MSSKHSKFCKASTTRDSGGFIALPWTVLDCPAYGRLSVHARALLLEVARQYVRDNNGRLLLTRDYMATRGWKSCDMLDKCKRELLDAGFIFETVKGQRPNKASWYAVTWQTLDLNPGYDAGAVEGFKRGAYRDADPLPKPKPTREELYRKWDTAEKNVVLNPPRGTGSPSIAPPHGTENPATVPPHGAMKASFAPLSVPPHGHHLDKPSTGVRKGVQGSAGNTGNHDGNKLENPTETQGEPSGNPRVIHGGPIETLADLWAAVGCRSKWVAPRVGRTAARLNPINGLLAA